MSKVAQYLQEHLVGEIMTGTDARRYFSTDGSILQLAPALVVYPKNENDVRKTARFTWQLAERGRVIPVTARGGGSSQSGAAIGTGIMLVFTAHMNRVLEIDTKANNVSVEPGINYGKLQQTLFTHSRFLPSYPATMDYSTVGGAVANNVIGEKSIKYGNTARAIERLRVVLANGEVIETGRLSKRELSKKLGLATFEGEIYRSIDTLLEEKNGVIQNLRYLSRTNAGYNLADIKRHDGTFDLTPLIAGSQGTLGIVTEVTLATEPHNPSTTLFLARFTSLEHLQNVVLELRELSDRPSAVEMVDGNVLSQVHEYNPNQLKDVITEPFPLAALLIELDGSDKAQKKDAKRVKKILDKYAINYQSTTDPEEQQNLRKVRLSVSSLLGYNEGMLRALPLFDGAVPLERLREFMDSLYKLLETNTLKPAVWGHVGEGVLHVQPRLNLGQIGDRQKIFRLMEEYNKLVLSLGGSISAESGDGRLRTPYLEAMLGTELYSIEGKIKQIFDPYNILNPGVKFGTTLDDIKDMMRPDFSLSHVYQHMPRS